MQGDPREAGYARNHGIDLFRGALAILVILGHFSELTHRHTFLTWLGFGFRMPLFIGLTGYLFDLERARAMSLPALLRRYHRRLIVPWLIACTVHLLLVAQIDWRMPMQMILRPPFHLWFVPVMIAFIVASWANPLRRGYMLAVAVPASIVAMYAFGVGHQIEQYHPWMPDRRYFTYPIYFTFGLWVACRSRDPGRVPLRILLAAIGLIWWCALYDNPDPAAEVAAEVLLCMPLIRLLPWVRVIRWDLPLIAGVGRDSLFFYLWHPLFFGLWSAAGLSGLPMLAASLLSIGLAWVVIARMPFLRNSVGIRAPERMYRAGRTGEPGAMLTAGTI